MSDKEQRVQEVLAELPGGAKGIEHLSESMSSAINEGIMNKCCYRERLAASFCDALREPHAERVDGEGWHGLGQLVPPSDTMRDVYVATDLYGFFRVPATRVSELLDTSLWSHEVYVVGLDIDWLVGVKHEYVFAQGKAAALLAP